MQAGRWRAFDFRRHVESQQVGKQHRVEQKVDAEFGVFPLLRLQGLPAADFGQMDNPGHLSTSSGRNSLGAGRGEATMIKMGGG